MGEIDTKPIEPVQVALTMFGEKSEQRKHRPGSGCSGDEMDKEKDFEGLRKDLANYKVQLEAKDAAYLQLLHKLEHYQKTADELSTQLKNSEVERDVCLEERREARFRIDELEAKIKEMGDQLLESGKIKEQLSHVLGELKAAQGELLSMEMELAAATEAKLKALMQAELMESAANMEKERAEELLKRVIDLNEAVFLSKQAAETVKFSTLSEKDAETKEASDTEAQTQKMLEDMKTLQEMMQELENKLRAKSVFIDSLQVELNQANELLRSSDKAVSVVINDLNQLKADLKGKEKENSDQAIYIGELENEMNQLKLELKNANDEVTHLNCEVEMLTDKLEKVKSEMEEITERENDAHIEISLLKAELHKGRSKIAAAEAADARAGNVKSGLHLAVQELAVEAEEAKKENQRLKQGSDMAAEERLDISLVGTGYEKSFYAVEAEKSRDDNDRNITISLEEYESLISRAAKVNQSAAKDLNRLENRNELETLKKELEVATAKVSEFRTRTEQAVTRAEAAERAKLALEDQLRKWREQKKRRKAALAALREESLSREYGSSSYDKTPTNYQPLGKVLNMEY
ncbi:hypothetical protein P3X46_023222 [Hevea brasiliensis]|uniref:Uncharacterized protein n=1 Tax=Hevea brasiliensis TaxID=3981 RepID=A0ABQ9LAD6_HEVBR|nr:protein WEAK CHLOROPLAST MOVEMENT UNDER BLUE LIGHT-like 3 [Hevea brasiliensis]KAJ9163571.1 hypothetical protein P3X46_023222 [Hevea brasiliensis]